MNSCLYIILFEKKRPIFLGCRIKSSRLFNRRLNLIDMTKTSVQFFPLKIFSDYIMIKVPNKWGDIYSSED